MYPGRPWWNSTVQSAWMFTHQSRHGITTQMEHTLGQVFLTCCLWSTQSTDPKDLTTSLYQGLCCFVCCHSVKQFHSYYSGIPISQASKGNENWFEKSEVQNIWGKITVKQILGKRLLVESSYRVFCEKSRVREIGIPLYMDFQHRNVLDMASQQY